MFELLMLILISLTGVTLKLTKDHQFKEINDTLNNSPVESLGLLCPCCGNGKGLIAEEKQMLLYKPYFKILESALNPRVSLDQYKLQCPGQSSCKSL